MNPDHSALMARLAGSAFRSRFHLTRKDRCIIAEKGWNVIEAEAEKILRERLAPAHPYRDGSQTPMRGYPVFTAQHATGLCCRGCMAKWHHIPAGHALTEEELAYAVSVIVFWLKKDAGDLSGIPHTPDLFQNLRKSSNSLSCSEHLS